MNSKAQALPGYRDPAQVRTFDAPEAMDIRFYEVQAKSVLNRVPKQIAGAVPLDDQPRIGAAAHACSLLHLRRHVPHLDGATGGPRRLAGRWCAGDERRTAPSGAGATGATAVVTRVLDHWSTIKPAYG